MKPNKFILCSSTCSPNEYRRLFPADKFKTGQSIQKYYRILCGGFVKNNIPITVCSKRPVNPRNTKSWFINYKDEKDEGIDYHYASVLNIKGIGSLYAFFVAFFWFLLKKNCTKRDSVIIDPLQLGSAIGCLLACKIRRIRTISYVTDIPKEYTKGNSLSSSFKSLSTWVQVNTSGMIFVTEHMNNIANPKGRPYVVIEGFVDEQMSKYDNDLRNKYDKKVVMYTGGVEKIYGLDMLAKGFIKANVENSELHIYGSGSYAKELNEYADLDSRIKFFGTKDNSVIVQEQIKASLLVNPRYTIGKYTKYSFPGKNLEYMVSGTPVLTTLLPGMPKDYISYVYILQEETIEGMASKLRELLLKPQNELLWFGLRAKQWMLTNKSSKAQVKKIINFVENSL